MGQAVPAHRLGRVDLPPGADQPGRTLYRLWRADGRLLYVGQTTQALAARLSAHARNRGWWGDVDAVTMETFPTIDALLAAERHTIRTEAPLFNRAGADRKAVQPGRGRDGMTADERVFLMTGGAL